MDFNPYYGPQVRNTARICDVIVENSPLVIEGEDVLFMRIGPCTQNEYGVQCCGDTLNIFGCRMDGDKVFKLIVCKSCVGFGCKVIFFLFKEEYNSDLYAFGECSIPRATYQ